MSYLLKNTFFLASLIYIINSHAMPDMQCIASPRLNENATQGINSDERSGSYEIKPELNKLIEIEENIKVDTEYQKWTGIDVSIVGKYAEKYGHPPRDPYINTDQGDLLLFVFTIAGVLGGFIIGYNIRKLFFEVDNCQKYHQGSTAKTATFKQGQDVTLNPVIRNEVKN